MVKALCKEGIPTSAERCWTSHLLPPRAVPILLQPHQQWVPPFGIAPQHHLRGSLDVTHHLPKGRRGCSPPLEMAPPAPREKEWAQICPHAQTPMMMQAERWTEGCPGEPPRELLPVPSVTHLRHNCPTTSSKPALSREMSNGFASHRQNRHK